MSINAGTIVAYLTLDTNKFTSAVSSAKSQLKTLSDESATFSQKMSAVGGSLSTVGMSLTQNVTTPIYKLGVNVSKFAISYEDAFAGVRKTLDATEEEYEQLSDSILRMASEMPTAAEDIAGVMEAAGQLGIQKENLESFTEVMVQLGDTTNLSADTAATTLARFANITGMSQDNFDRLGSTIVDLGNNFATTEAEISDMALRIAGAGKQVGMSEADIMGVAAALSSVGLEAAAGGTAISKVLTDMSLAVEKGVNSSNTSLANFAKVAGMTSEEFAAAFKDDAAGALSAFIVGLGSLEEGGGSAIAVLDEMGITEVRMRDALLRSSGAADTFTSALQTASNAWEENTALTTEAEKRYETTASQLKILWNQIKALGIQFGEILLPYIRSGITYVGKLVTWFGNLNGETKKVIVNVSLVVAAIGPVITVVGRLISTFSKLKTVATAVSTAMTTLKAACLAHPYIAFSVAAVTIVTALTSVAIAASKVDNGYKQLGNTMSNIMSGTADFVHGISTASSVFTDDSVFSSDESDNISSSIDSVQKKITAITELASSERRELTQKEIKLLEQYFEELNSLTEKQYEIYESKALALSVLITEEGKMSVATAQSYLASAQEIRDESITLAKQSYAEQVAVITKGYSTIEDFNNRATQSERDQLAEAQRIRDERIEIANSQYAGITELLTKQYEEQNIVNAEWIRSVQQYNSDIEAENSKHAQKLDEYNYKNELTESRRQEMQKKYRKEEKRHNSVVKELNADLISSFDDVAQSQASSWLGMIAVTEAAGGEIDSETREMVNGLISIIGILPDDAKKSMRNTWLGMKEELESAESELYAAAEADANSIINAIDTALGIASPSRVMRERGKFIAQGLAEGIIEEKDNLLSDLGDILDVIKEKAGNLSLESAGANAMEGLRLGMKKKKNSLLETAGNIANSIGAKIRSAFDIHSPSRVMAAIGAQVSAGLAVGMEEYAYTVKDAAGSLASIATDTVDTATRNTITSGSITSSRENTVERKLDNVIDLLNQLLLIRDGDVVMDGRVFGRWVREVIT